MAIYYARSNLNSWGDTTGWSLTSGGPSAGVVPSSSDYVVFDANSGAARNISLPTNYSMQGVTMNPANRLSFGPSNTLTVNGNGLSGVSAIFNNVDLQCLVLVYGAYTGTTVSVNGDNATVRNLTFMWNKVALTGDLTVTNQFVLQSDSALGSFFNDNGHNITAGSINSGTSGGYAFTCSCSGIWTINGGDSNMASLTFNTAPSIIFTAATTGTTTLYLPMVNGGVGAYPYLELNMPLTSTGIEMSGSYSNLKITTLVIKPGAILYQYPNGQWTITNMTADGSGSHIRIKNNQTFNVSGKAILNYVDFSNASISFSPAARGTNIKGTPSGVTIVPLYGFFQNF